MTRWLELHGLSPAEADDELQMVFIIAMLRESDIPLEDDRAKRWLVGVARKRAAGAHRRLFHRYEVLNPGFVNDAAAPPEDPEEQMASIMLVNDATRDMARTDLEVLVRYFSFDESYAEIGEQLGISKSNAHLRLGRAHATFLRRIALLLEEKKTKVWFFLPLWSLGEKLRAVFREWLVPRWPALGRLPLPSFLQVLPSATGPALGLLVSALAQPGVLGPSKTSTSAAVEPMFSALPRFPMLAPSEAPRASALGPAPEVSNGKASQAPPSQASLAAPSGEAADAEEKRLYEQIRRCVSDCTEEEGSALVLKYTVTYPSGLYTREVKALQRQWAAKKKARSGSDP